MFNGKASHDVALRRGLLRKRMKDKSSRDEKGKIDVGNDKEG